MRCLASSASQENQSCPVLQIKTSNPKQNGKEVRSLHWVPTNTETAYISVSAYLFSPKLPLHTKVWSPVLREYKAGGFSWLNFHWWNADYCFYCTTFPEYHVSTLNTIKVIAKRSVLVILWNVRTMNYCVLEAKITLTFLQSGEGASDMCTCLDLAVMDSVSAHKIQHPW